MLRKYSRRANYGILIGIAGEFAVAILFNALNLNTSSYALVTLVVYLGFGLLFAWGIINYLIARGRSPFWILILGLNLIGLIVLGSLQDKYKEGSELGVKLKTLVDVIKSHPDMDFDSIKSQALEAGFDAGLTKKAWEEAHAQ